MSLPLDFDIKERVRMAVDIVDVMGSLELRPQGRGYVARCPWHDDRRPSLQINPQRQTWKCWVCDIGGDVFSYVMRRDGVEFFEALKILAERAGIELPTSRQDKAAVGSGEDKATLLSAVKFAATAYSEWLETGDGDEVKRARDYLAQRGIDDASRQKFQIGLAPENWSWLIDEGKRAGFPVTVLHAAGLAAARKSGNGFIDLFRGRLMFPICDLHDRPISMGGRVIPGGDFDSPAKYINGPETRLFSKSRQLYGLNLARATLQRSGEVLVMEGYTDVITAHQAGIDSAVAVLGTALSEHHIKILERFVDRVVLVLDGDEAGRRRADQVLELFVTANVDLRIITLPGGSDPADFIATQGAEAMRRLAADAPDALDHKLAGLIDGVDLTQDTHRAHAAMEQMLAVLAKGGNPNDLRTAQMLVRLSRTFGLPTEMLRGQLATRINRQRTGGFRTARSPASGATHSDPSADGVSAARSRGGTGSRGAAAAVNEAQPQPSGPLAPITGIDRELFEIMIEYPEAAAHAIEAIDPQWLHSQTARLLMRAYQDLELAGHELDLSSLLLALEDERLKSVVVGLDHGIQQRQRFTSQPFDQRFPGLLERYRLRQQMLTAEQTLSQMAADGDDVDSAAKLLGDLIAAQRLRQGLRPN